MSLMSICVSIILVNMFESWEQWWLGCKSAPGGSPMLDCQGEATVRKLQEQET